MNKYFIDIVHLVWNICSWLFRFKKCTNYKILWVLTGCIKPKIKIYLFLNLYFNEDNKNDFANSKQLYIFIYLNILVLITIIKKKNAFLFSKNIFYTWKEFLVIFYLTTHFIILSKVVILLNFDLCLANKGMFVGARAHHQAFVIVIEIKNWDAVLVMEDVIRFTLTPL